MRKEYLGYKRIAIPIITMALIVSSWMPSMNVGNFIGEHRDGVAIVEMYNSEALAATVDYNKVQKTYNVRVFIDNVNNEMKFTKDSGKPFIALNRTFIPYRVMGEALGAKVDWDNNLRKVTATGNNNKVEMYIGHKTYGVNNEVKQMDVEPFILSAEGRTYIPARYITEGLNYYIDFTQKDGQMYVIVFTKGQNEDERNQVLNELDKGEAKGEVKVEVKVDKEYKSIGEIVGGKLTQEQVRQLQKNIDSKLSAAKLEWRDWPENDEYHMAFVKAIKERLGQNTIVDHRLFARDRTGINKYFVIETDGTVSIVEVGFKIDGAPNIGVTGFVPNVL